MNDGGGGVDEIRNMSDDMAALVALDVISGALREFMDNPQMLDDKENTLHAMSDMFNLISRVMPTPGSASALALAAVKKVAPSLDYQRVRDNLERGKFDA